MPELPAHRMLVTVDAPEIGPLTFACHDDFLYRVMKQSGRIYEYTLLHHIAQTVPRHGIFVDVGACIGTHSVFFAKLGVEVLACEPIEDNYALLHENLCLNGVRASVTDIPRALGDHLGYVTMTHSPQNWGQCAIDRVVAHSATRLSTLDYELSTVSERISLIKIDVEGFEREVLTGATVTLTTWHPTLFIEIKRAAATHAIDVLLAPYGYTRRTRFGGMPMWEFL